MYTVPAKVPIQAKQLIATFEKGEFIAASNDEDGDAAPVDGGLANGVRLNREVSIEELAQPGTARRLLLEFESRAQQSAIGTGVPLKSPPFSANKRLTTNLTNNEATELNAHCNGNVTSVSADAVKLNVEEHVKVGQAEVQASQTTNESVSPVAVVGEALQAADESVIPVADVVASPTADDIAAATAELDAVVNNAEEAGATVTTADCISETLTVEAPSVPTSKTVHIVCATRDRTPLDVALLEATTRHFETAQHVVTTSDVFNLSTNLNADADEERRKVATADLLIIAYQPTFNCVPTSLQTWIETVFDLTQSISATFTQKKCLVVLTTPRRQEEFTADSVLGDISSYVWSPQVRILRHAGFDVVEPQVIFGANDAAIDDVTDKWCARLTKIWDETAQVSSR